ncbi:MAG: efflux RND transporter periplasmic adaptor subunit [Planctomycetota bacterium]|nr:efflux RND transporter periplasmic adaptor subunit [Planctomycetota bacterium]
MDTTYGSINRAHVVQAVAALTARHPSAAKPKQARWYYVAPAAVVLGVSALAWSGFSKAQPAAAAPAMEPQPDLRSVSVARPVRGSTSSEILLPADVEPYQATAIHARIGGYLKAWHVDRGARVKAGQVLAEIDAPEFDQALRQARSQLDEGRAQLEQARTEREQSVANLAAGRANVQKAQATLELAAKTVERFKDLEEKWAATRQQYDEAVRNHEAARAELEAAKADAGALEAAVATKAAAIRTAEARVASLNANVRRLEETESFKTLVAPFDGIVTRREADVGALVPADGSKELFAIDQDDTLRVKVNVPQTYAGQIRAGQEADVVAREFSNEDWAAKVARTSGAIDSAARTLTVELELNNRDHRLLPGAYAQVRFRMNDERSALRVAASTLRFTKEGPQVVAVDARGRLSVAPVKLGRDFGAQVEVTSGLNGGELLVVNPTDSMHAGEEVRIAPEAPAKNPAR